MRHEAITGRDLSTRKRKPNRTRLHVAATSDRRGVPTCIRLFNTDLSNDWGRPTRKTGLGIYVDGIIEHLQVGLFRDFFFGFLFAFWHDPPPLRIGFPSSSSSSSRLFVGAYVASRRGR